MMLKEAFSTADMIWFLELLREVVRESYPKSAAAMLALTLHCYSFAGFWNKKGGCFELVIWPFSFIWVFVFIPTIWDFFFERKKYTLLL